MIRRNKKKTPPGHIKTLVLSVILAVAVWITVSYLNDPDITTTVSSLDVRFAGEMMLKNKGLVVTNKSSVPTLSVVVSGKRSDLIAYLDKLYVEFDVSNINSAGEYTLSGTTSLPSTRITVEKEKYNDIPITIEELEEKEISVTLNQVGTNRNKLIRSELLQQTVVISGAKSEIDKVESGVAEIDISAVTQNEKTSAPFLLKDVHGNLIEKNETIETATAELPIKNTVYERKTLPIRLSLSDELKDKYVLDEEKSAVSNSSVEVGLLSENHDDCVFAQITSASDEQEEYELAETDGMYIPESRKRVKAKVELIPLEQRAMLLPIELTNIPDGLSVSGEVSVYAVVYGAKDKLNADNIRAYADLSGLGAGEHKVDVTIEGDSIRVNSEYEVTVELQ